MKWRFYLWASFALQFGMTSCINDDLPVNPHTEDIPVLLIKYEVSGGTDQLSVFSISATYTDVNGKDATVNISKLPWNKEITPSPPFTTSLKVFYTKKNNIPEKDTYILGETGGITYTKADGNSGGGFISYYSTVPKSKLNDYINTAVTQVHEYRYIIK